MGVMPRFAWPVRGPLTSLYGPLHPTGIDIGLAGIADDRIAASAGGVVTTAGGDPCCDYGYHVVIDHGNGYTTLYGHLSSITVRPGDTVSQGQLLGYGGDTGKTDGKHLHFEIRNASGYLDPLRFLPGDPAFQVTGTAPVDCRTTQIELQQATTTTLYFKDQTGPLQVKYAEVKGRGGARVMPALKTEADGRLSIDVPAAALSASTSEYDLTVAVQAGEQELAVTCRLLLKPSSVVISAEAYVRAGVTPTPVPTNLPGTATPLATLPAGVTPAPPTPEPFPTPPAPPTPTAPATYTPTSTATSTATASASPTATATATPTAMATPTFTPTPTPTKTPTPTPVPSATQPPR